MIEKSILTHRLTALEEYLADLGEIDKDLDRSKFIENKIIRRYVERTLQVATEACLDIANHIISYEGYREPEDNNVHPFIVMAGFGIGFNLINLALLACPTFCSKGKN